MTDAHLHLLVNHFPIIVPILGLLVLVAGFILKNTIVKRTALGILLFGALMAFPANFTGEGAEEMIEEMPGISHDKIEAHEEAAEVFIWVAGLLGLLSAVTLFLDIKNKPIAKGMYLVVLAAAIAVLVLGKQTGTTGGEIRHPEIIKGATNASPANGAGEQENGDHD